MFKDMTARLREEDFAVSLPREKQFVDPCLWIILLSIFGKEIENQNSEEIQDAVARGVKYLVDIHHFKEEEPTGTWDRLIQEDCLGLLALLTARYECPDLNLGTNYLEKINRILRATFLRLIDQLDGNEMSEHFLTLNNHCQECFIIMDIAQSLRYLEKMDTLQNKEIEYGRKLTKRMVETVEGKAVTSDLLDVCYWRSNPEKHSFAAGDVYDTSNGVLAITAIHDLSVFSAEVNKWVVLLLKQNVVMRYWRRFKYYMSINKRTIQRVAVVGVATPMVFAFLSLLGIPYLNDILTNIIADVIFMIITFYIFRRRSVD